LISIINERQKVVALMPCPSGEQRYVHDLIRRLCASIAENYAARENGELPWVRAIKVDNIAQEENGLRKLIEELKENRFVTSDPSKFTVFVQDIWHALQRILRALARTHADHHECTAELKKLFYKLHQIQDRFADVPAYRQDLGAVKEKYRTERAVAAKIGVQVLLSAWGRDGELDEMRRCDCPACAACRQLRDEAAALLDLPRSAQLRTKSMHNLYFGSPDPSDIEHVQQCLRVLASDLSVGLATDLAAKAAGLPATAAETGFASQLPASLLTCGVFPVHSPADGGVQTTALYVAMSDEARALLLERNNTVVSTKDKSKWLTTVNLSARPGIVTKDVATIIENQMSDVVAKGLFANYDCAHLFRLNSATGTLPNEEWHRFLNHCIMKGPCDVDKRIMDIKLAASAFNARKDEIEKKLQKGSHADLSRERRFLQSQRVGIVIPVTPPHPSWLEIHKDIVELRRRKRFHWTDENVAFLMSCLKEWIAWDASHPPTATQSSWSWIHLNRRFPGAAQPPRDRLQRKIMRPKESAHYKAFPELAKRITATATLPVDVQSESENAPGSRHSAADMEAPLPHEDEGSDEDVDQDAGDASSISLEHAALPCQSAPQSEEILSSDDEDRHVESASEIETQPRRKRRRLVSDFFILGPFPDSPTPDVDEDLPPFPH